jgi:hypothetical protein
MWKHIICPIARISLDEVISMKEILKSWLFFTSLLFLILTFALVLPSLEDRLFGNTEQQLTATVDQITQEAQAVWAKLEP